MVKKVTWTTCRMNRRVSLMVTYITLVQLVTGLFILLSPQPILVARLGFFYEMFSDPRQGGVLMLLGAIIALAGLFRRNHYQFLFFLPQFVFLILTSGSALYYVAQSSYADGILRSWQFIFIDQLHTFAAVILYTFAIFDFEKEPGAEKVC